MWLLIAINNYIREQGSLGLIPDFSLNSVYYENIIFGQCNSKFTWQLSDFVLKRKSPSTIMGWDWNIKLTSEVRPARSWNKSRCAMDIEHCLWDHCQFPPDLAFNCLIPDNAGYPSDYKCGTIFAHLLLTETVLPQKVANALSVETLRRRGISLDRIRSDIPWPYRIG